LGSKNKISKYIVPIIQSYIDKYHINTYVEPFVGGANIIDKIRCNNKIGYDKNKYLIALLQNVNKIKELPDNISKSHYDDVRKSFYKHDNRYEDWYIGAVGFLASYNGRFFDGGFAKNNYTKQSSGHIVFRNYFKEAKQNLIKQIPNLKNIRFENQDYINLHNISNSCVYCDPPYQNSKHYMVDKNFDYSKFWKWIRDVSKNNIVLISEFNAPKDMKCLWEHKVSTQINSKRYKFTEKLFIANVTYWS